MKKIKERFKWWLAKKLHKYLLPYVRLNLTTEEYNFLLNSENKLRN